MAKETNDAETQRLIFGWHSYFTLLVWPLTWYLAWLFHLGRYGQDWIPLWVVLASMGAMIVFYSRLFRDMDFNGTPATFSASQWDEVTYWLHYCVFFSSALWGFWVLSKVLFRGEVGLTQFLFLGVVLSSTVIVGFTYVVLTRNFQMIFLFLPIKFRYVDVVFNVAFPVLYLSFAASTFSGLLTVLMWNGLLELDITQPDLEVNYQGVTNYLYWHVADMVPILKIPATIRWPEPYVHSDSLSGTLVLAFKILIALPFLKATEQLIRRLVRIWQSQ